MTIYEDNMPVLHICKNQVTSQRTKHFALALHYVRECIERGVIRVEYISTHRQLADALTKALPKPLAKVVAKLEVIRLWAAREGSQVRVPLSRKDLL